MFCEKCGAKNPDNARFCARCGEMIPEYITPAPVRKGKPKFIGLIAIVLAVVLVFVGIFSIFGGRSAKNTANLVMNGLTDLDLVKIFKLVPDPVRDSILEEDGSTPEEFEQMLIEENEDLAEDLNAFGTIIIWKNNGLEDASEDVLEDLKAQYSSNYDMKITDAKVLHVQASVTVLGMTETNDFSFNLIKYKGSWYVDPHTLGNVF